MNLFRCCAPLFLLVAANAAPDRAVHLGRLPLSFEPLPGNKQFLARTAGLSVAVRSNGASLHLSRGGRKADVQLTFAGASSDLDGRTSGVLPGKVNYFIGPNPRNWRTNVPTFGKVEFAHVYRGIDVAYYGNGGQLEYDFLISPGADPNVIRLHFSGDGTPRLDKNGNVVFNRHQSGFTQHRPVAYQQSGTTRDQVDAHYRLLSSGDVGVEVGPYDRKRPLVIDPVLSYSSYLGGVNNDGILGVKVDATGALYMVGFSASADFKTTPGALRRTYAGRQTNQQFFGFGDAVVAKLNPAGTALVYSTYLGGSADDVAMSVALDAAGNAFVTGSTQSSDFPVTAGAYQTRFGGMTDDAFYSRGDAFVVKLGPAGDRILWGTYFGGSSNEMGFGIAVDPAGNPVIAGDTISTNLPVTTDAISKSYRGGANIATNPSGDAFVARFNSTGTALQYASYIGGRSHDTARMVAFDPSGNLYIAGGTYSSDFPTTPGAFQTKGGVVETTSSYDAAADDAWVMKFDPQNKLLYSTYLGGSYRDTAFGLTADAAGNAYVTGRTRSNNFPVTPNALQRSYGGTHARGTPGDSWDGDVFLTKLNPSGTALVYSTYIGGSGDEAAFDVAVDADANMYIAGYTLSTEFPVSSDAIQKTFGGLGGQGLSTGGPPPEGDVNTGDAFVMKLDNTGKLVYSSFFGGSMDDMATTLAIDSARNVYIGGITLSQNLPTSSPVQSSFAGGATLFPRGDGFVAKFDFGGKLASVPVKLVFDSSVPASGPAGATLTPGIAVVVTDANQAGIPGLPVTFTAANAALDNATAVTDAQGRASAGLRLGTAGTATVTATVPGLAPVTYSIVVNPVAANGPAITALANGASFASGPVAPGSWMTLGGANLAPAEAGATSVPLPTSLGSVRVKINGIYAPLLYVNANQINVQLPYETPVGDAVAVVEVNGIASAPFPFKVQPAAPGIFLYNGNHAVAQNVNDDGSVTVNSSSAPVTPGKPLVVYFTGQGALDNPISTGTPAGFGTLSRPLAPYSITVGDMPAVVDFVGMTPGNIALGQANIRVPDLDAGDYPVVLTVGGHSVSAMISVGARK